MTLLANNSKRGSPSLVLSFYLIACGIWEEHTDLKIYTYPQTHLSLRKHSQLRRNEDR